MNYPPTPKAMVWFYAPFYKVGEALDGPAISLADNQGLERMKGELIEKNPEILPVIYEIVDAIFAALPASSK